MDTEMKSVQVLLSSYNGEKYIARQIDSILAQESVDIHLLIRDDGSKDGTRAILSDYESRFPERIKVVTGDNLGYKKSFLTLIRLAGDYDYYAFADQDDYWLSDKESSSIAEMETDPEDIPKLAQVDFVVTDENLKPVVPAPVHPELCVEEHDRIYVGEFFQGCLMTWNRKAMELLKSYTPKGDYSHDHWIGKVIYLLGRVYFVPQKEMDYTRHGDNTSVSNDLMRTRWLRVKALFSGGKSVYYNMGQDLLDGYRSLLSPHDFRMCEDFARYKHSFSAKRRLLMNGNLRRTSFMATVLYKFCILINRV